MRTFEYNDEKSSKFWNVELTGKSFTVQFGKIGSQGQTQTKEFPTVEKARKAYEKLIAEKTEKGYVETTAGATPQVEKEISPVQAMLEKAIFANPDDLASHSAYADFLMEQGDPRGEFIQVQLALEDESKSPKERKKLHTREAELLAAHAKTWIGDPGRFLVGDWSGDGKPYFYSFHRGWLDAVRALPEPDALVAALVKSPEARLLRKLEIVYEMEYHPFDFDPFTKGPNAVLREGEAHNEMYEGADILWPLCNSNVLGNLRVLKLGFSDHGEHIGYSTMIRPFEDFRIDWFLQLLSKCPRLEELYLNTDIDQIGKLFSSSLMGSLRVFQFYYGSEYDHGGRGNHPYPLQVLAANPAAKNLETLRFHAGRESVIQIDPLDALLKSPNLPNLKHLQVRMTQFADEGARRVVESGVLKKLKTLDLGHGNMTDEGARLLAECPDLKHLERLEVSRNALTAKGISALKKTGVKIVAEFQHEADNDEYLYEVDHE